MQVNMAQSGYRQLKCGATAAQRWCHAVVVALRRHSRAAGVPGGDLGVNLAGAGGGGRMRVGLHALGIGTGARPEVIRSVAMSAEAAGFATLWAGEHVVLVDQPTSRYPYSADGRIAVPAAADWLDPLLGLSFIAGVT